MLFAGAVLLLSALAADTGSGAAPAPARPPRPPPRPVRITGDIGFVSTAGNTSVQTLNLGDKIVARKWYLTFTQQFAVMRGQSGGSTVASSWRALGRVDLAVQKIIAAYTAINWERNVFSGLASRVGTTSGLSAAVIRTSTDHLVFEGGVSYTTQHGIGSKGVDKDFFGGRAATAYTHHLGPRAAISQSVELLPDFHDSADLRINTESDLLAPLTKQIAMKMSYSIHYDGVPEPGYLSTDRLFTTGIQVTL
jgi:putative salt-induced outer membrane protein YdiY